MVVGSSLRSCRSPLPFPTPHAHTCTHHIECEALAVKVKVHALRACGLVAQVMQAREVRVLQCLVHRDALSGVKHQHAVDQVHGSAAVGGGDKVIRYGLPFRGPPWFVIQGAMMASLSPLKGKSWCVLLNQAFAGYVHGLSRYLGVCRGLLFFNQGVLALVCQLEGCRLSALLNPLSRSVRPSLRWISGVQR